MKRKAGTQALPSQQALHVLPKVLYLIYVVPHPSASGDGSYKFIPYSKMHTRAQEVLIRD